MSLTKERVGAEVCRRAFGAVLTEQGRGFYVALELLAMVWGTNDLKRQILPPTGALTFRRRSHDFARRIMAGMLPENEERHLRGQKTKEILRALLVSLRVPIPNRRELPDWLGQHIYPYAGELVHYDAATRNTRISMERYSFRGGGGLAHKILRTDQDLERLSRNRQGLLRLVEDGGGPLGQLASACAKHDSAAPDEFTDDREERTLVDVTDWVEHLRQGICNITSRSSVRAKQVELLTHWVPYCIARHQLDRATKIVGAEPMLLPVAIVGQSTPLRQIARRSLDQARGFVDEALRVRSDDLARGTDPESAVFATLAAKRSWRYPFVAFLSQTLATVGALNAHVGTRYFTLQLTLLETLVCATLQPGQSLKLEEFCDLLLSKYRIVAGPRTPAGTSPLARMDAADLAANSEQLASDLTSLGLLTSYSDATRMVHGEVA